MPRISPRSQPVIAYVEKSLRVVLLAAGAMACWVAPSTAAAQAGDPPLDFCFTPPSGPGACYPSEAQAVAAMRASTLVGEYLVKAEESPTNNPEWRWVVYRAEKKVAPESIGTPGYSIGGWSATDLGCVVSSGDGPGFPYCQSEAEAISLWVANRAAFLSRYSCTYLRNSTVGAHGVPHGLMGSYSASRWGAAVYGAPPSAGGRYIDEAWWCPGWGTPDPVEHPTQITKVTPFTCPAGFVIVNPAEEWPLVCSPRDNMRQMTVRIRQAESCQANANPCYPATGEKQRHEADFQFAGETFVRSYRSAGLFQQGNLGARWHHSHGSRIGGTYYNRPHVITDDGSYLALDWVSRSGDVTTYVARGLTDRIVKATPSTYEMVDDAGHTRIYDAVSGRLTHRRHATNAAHDLAYGYDSDGYLSSVTDGRGLTLTFHHSEVEVSRAINGSSVVVDTDRVLTEVVLPDGKVYEYAYDAYGNLAAVIRPDGSSRQYHYDESAHVGAPSIGLMTGISDNGQRYATFTYDAYGRVTSSTLAGGVERTELTYVSRDIVDVTTPNGLVRRYTYQPGVLRNLLSVADSFGTIQNIYDSYGRKTESIDRAGRRTRFSHTNGKITGITEAPGTELERVTAISRDTLGRVTGSQVSAMVGGVLTPVSRSARALDAQGRVLASCAMDPGGPGAGYVCGSAADAPAGVRQASFSYCTEADVSADPAACPLAGLLRSVDGPQPGAADSVQYVYRSTSETAGCGTSTGDCHRMGDLWKVLDPMGRATEILRHDLAGRVARVRDMNQVVTTMGYDALGRLASQTVLGADGSSTADDMTSAFEYNDVGLVEKITQPDGAFVQFGYDAAYRLTRVQDSLGNTINYALDAAGNRFAEETRDDQGTLARTLSRLFDDLGRVTTLADADANATELAYDAAGQLDTVSDALGRTSDNAYDSLGRLRQSIANVGGVGAERAETQYEYDARDNLVAVVDPKGLTTAYTYDGMGDLVGLQSPDTGTTTYAYDNAGNRIRQLDARGVETIYSYDVLNRLTGMDLPTEGQDIGFEYDSAPTACQNGERFAVGRLSGFTDPSGRTDYCFDRSGNVVRKVQVTSAGPTRTVRYQHNAAGRVMSVTYPSGLVLTYTRNAAGQVTAVTAKNSANEAPVALVTGASYLPFGPLNSLTFGNGRVLEKSYDLNYDIASVADNAADGLSIDYSLNDVGNVVGLAERQNGGTSVARTVDYDGLDRLTALKTGTTPVQAFTYDATGNRTSRRNGTGAVSNYLYAPDSHRLTQVGSQIRVYDAMGNATTIHARNYVYDDRGRMQQSRNGTTVLRDYRYNALGQRVAKLHPTTATSSVFYVYDEAGKLLGEYKPNGALIKEYLWLDDTLVAVRGGYSGHKFQYVLTDHLNTPRAIVLPATNTIIWRWDLGQTAFGDHAAQNNPDGDTANYVFNLRYPGQYLDSETGLHYNYFRDYEPGTGRYVQSDPIGLAGGGSTYGYVSGSPLRGTDPLGLFDVVAGYGSSNGSHAFRYQFNFQSSMAEVWAARSSSTARSRVAGAVGGVARILALSQNTVEGNVQASPAGMADLYLDPLGELTGETLLEQCAAADGGFEAYYNSKYSPGDWLDESQALELLEQFRLQLNKDLMDACRGQSQACRQPFHDVMDFYGLRDPLAPGNPIPRVLLRAQGRMDTASNALLKAYPP